MASNPNPDRITDAQWWLMEQLLALEPGTRNGGIYANKPGYHGTRADNRRNWPGNYSIVDAEDQGGPDDKAAALDWTFPTAQAGDYRRIAVYCKRLMASSLDVNDPRLDGWREWYGQADSDADVEGWDSRYLQHATSDSSHLWHIHFSEDRDKVTSLANKQALLSVLRGETDQQQPPGGTPGSTGGDEDMYMAQVSGNPAVYLVTGTAPPRHITPAEYDLHAKAGIAHIVAPPGSLAAGLLRPYEGKVNYLVGAPTPASLSEADRADIAGRVLAGLASRLPSRDEFAADVARRISNG